MKSRWIMSLLALSILATSALAAPPPYPTHPEWTNPIPPFRIADNLYYVGSQDLTS